MFWREKGYYVVMERAGEVNRRLRGMGKSFVAELWCCSEVARGLEEGLE